MKTDRSLEVAEFQEQAWGLQADGRLKEAAAKLEQALLILEETAEAESPDAANLLNDLAEIQIALQNFPVALTVAERAQAIESLLGERFAGKEAAEIRARTMGFIGEISRMRGEYKRAETALREALDILTVEFGESSEQVAEARNNLAVLYKYWGRFDESLELYQMALRTITSIHGEDSLASSVVYHNIGGLFHSKGDFDSAEPPGNKAWEISRRGLGENHPQTLLDAVAYAGILDGLERYDESNAIYRRALGIFEKTFGAEHIEVASIVHNLAASCCAKGDLNQAEQLYRRALAIQENLLGPESTDAALTRNNLGALLNLMRRETEAAPMLRSVVSLLQERLTPDHPYLVLAQRNLQTALLS